MCVYLSKVVSKVYLCLWEMKTRMIPSCKVQESTIFYSFIFKLHKQSELVQYLREWKLQKKVLVTFTKNHPYFATISSSSTLFFSLLH